MKIFSDFINIQKKTFRRTFKNQRYLFLTSILLIAGVISMDIISNIILTILNISSILTGILIYILKISLIGFFMAILYRAVKDSKLNRFNLNYDFGIFATKLMQVGFLIYIVELLVSRFFGKYFILLYVLSIIIFNALPEMIYIEEYNGYESIKQSVKFLQNNLINWGLPNLIFLGIFYSFTNKAFIPTMLQLDLGDIKSIIISIITIVVIAIFMIYRGVLFDELNGSSRRKREFMRNFNND